MASGNEMRAVGVAAKFVNAFAKNGGSLDMLNWLADDPGMMKRVVDLADRRLLARGTAHIIKWSRPFAYNPSKCLRPGHHEGVHISELSGDLSRIAPDEERVMPNVCLVAYTLRREAPLCEIYREMNERGIDNKVSVDHLWAALLQTQVRILAGSGNITNDFHLEHHVHSGSIYAPTRVRNAASGWIIEPWGHVTPNDVLRAGTQFIVNGDRNSN